MCVGDRGGRALDSSQETKGYSDAERGTAGNPPLCDMVAGGMSPISSEWGPGGCWSRADAEPSVTDASWYMYTLYMRHADRVQTARAACTSQCGSPQSTTTTSPTNLRAQNDWMSRDNSIAPPSRPSADPSAVHDQGTDDGGTRRHEVLNHIDCQMRVRCAIRYRTSRTASGKVGVFHHPPAVSANDNQLRLLLEHEGKRRTAHPHIRRKQSYCSGQTSCPGVYRLWAYV